MQLFQRGIDSSTATYAYKELKIKPGDNISVNVFTQATNNQEQASLLNLFSNGKTNGVYLVDLYGKVEFPKIGATQVAGLTIKELKQLLTGKWSPLVKNIVVNVQFQDITVNVIGEVRSPGSKQFTKETVNLIEVLAAVGGVTDDAKRSDILIIREEDGKRLVNKVDLRDASFYNSPFFQMQQNDLIVVGTSDYKFRMRANIDYNQRFTTAFTFINIFNFILGMAILISTLTK